MSCQLRLAGSLHPGFHPLPCLGLTLPPELGHGPGASFVAERELELVVLHRVRAWLREPPEAATPSWLMGLCDPQLEASLEAIHNVPEQRWTLTTLARRASMSRSGFAARFTARVGEPPLRYLTRWRLHLATVAQAEGKSLRCIARGVGYGSEATLRRALRRWEGNRSSHERTRPFRGAREPAPP